MLLDRLLRPIVGTITPSFSTSLPGVSFLISVGRGFRTSGHVMGLEEFFPKTVNIIEESEKTGRPWKARELRNKSNEDLHKLWYVLLKERNMLLTMKHEANRQRFIMPAPERMRKVKYSMHMIKIVIEERNKAVRDAKRILQERERNQRMKKIKTKGRLKL